MRWLFDGFWTHRIPLSGIRPSWMFWAILLTAERQLRPDGESLDSLSSSR